MSVKLFPTIVQVFKSLNVKYNSSYLKNKLKEELAVDTYGFEIPDSILWDPEAMPDKAWDEALKNIKAIMYTLDHYAVSTTVIEDTDFSIVTAPALIGIYRESGKPAALQISYSWLFLNKTQGDKFYLFDEQSKEIIMSLDEIKACATGISVSITKTKISAEPEYKRNKFSSNINRLGLIAPGLSLLGLFLLVGYMGVQTTNTFYSLLLPLLVIKLIGIYFVFELKKVETNPADSGGLSKFCNLAEGYSCQSVLNSKGASILYGKINLSSIGFIYFLGGILSILLAVITANSSAINVLAVIATLALPFTLYSIVYQWRVIKTWCILCLAVQLLLWIEFLVYYFNSNLGLLPVDNTGVVILLFGFIVAIALNFFMDGYYREKNKLSSNSALLSSWRRNTDVFKTLMDKAPGLAELPPLSIRTGNEGGKIEIVAVLGLTCIHCRKTYAELQQLADKRKDISLLIVPTNGPVLNDFLALASQHKHAVAAQSLTSWYDLLAKNPKPAGNTALKAYSEKLYSKWKAALKFDIKKNESEISGQVKLQRNWLSRYNFSTVPKVFVNRKLWGPPYQLNSIDYFFDEFEKN